MKEVVLQSNGGWLRFVDPVREVVAWRVADVAGALREVETAVSQQNLHAAGFMTYEASAAFNLAVHDPAPDSLPLLWFGLFQKPERLDSLPSAPADYQLGDWTSRADWHTYQDSIHKIKNRIAAGDTYQVNYTFPLCAPFRGDAWALFTQLAQAQQAEYAAYIDLGRFAICSASPELFFRQDGDRLTARPMKGTAERGRTTAEDRAQMAWLAQSGKNRAENVMIVDMMRNDLGRIAELGSVEVPQLFEIERYPTLLQMTSSVTAHSQKGIAEIIANLFPCASITGAPKVRTMEIIRELEPQPRGVYTGMIGMIAPERQAQFNVAIRTVVVDRERQEAKYGVGSGIVWDSDAAAEYAECQLKTQVLSQRWPDFELLESLLWTPGESYFLLDYHLDRLLETAVYFSIPLTRRAAAQHLQQLAATLTAPCKVRLLVGQRGQLTSQAGSLESGARVEPVRVGLTAVSVNTSNIWLYHKTTHRDVYQTARAAHPDWDDVILHNEQGHITEALFSNIVVLLDGEWLTPPVESGLLAGTFRRHLLVNGRIHERTLTIHDLRRSEQVFLINSVRKWQKAVFL